MWKRKRLIQGVQIAALLVMALSVLAMYFTDLCYDKSYYKLLLYVNGGTFWLSLFLLVISSLLIDVLRRRSKSFKRIQQGERQIGIISFCKNRYAVIADISLAISLTGMACLCIFRTTAQFLMFLFLSFSIFSFGMHCILNGMNYRYVTFDQGGKDHHGLI